MSVTNGKKLRKTSNITLESTSEIQPMGEKKYFSHLPSFPVSVKLDTSKIILSKENSVASSSIASTSSAQRASLEPSSLTTKNIIILKNIQMSKSKKMFLMNNKLYRLKNASNSQNKATFVKFKSTVKNIKIITPTLTYIHNTSSSQSSMIDVKVLLINNLLT